MQTATHNTCPYTLAPLASIETTNDEHIFPDAIGGVLGYRVRVDAKRNADLGRLVDAPLLNSPLIAGMRLIHGIRSRTAPPQWRMRGRIRGTDKQVEITFPSTGPAEVHVRKPVEMDAQGGGGTAVFQVPDRDELLRRLAADYARKGKTLLLGTETTLGDEYELDLAMDAAAIKRGMLKIAYAAVYECIGDAFLQDPLIPEWHRALFGATHEEAMRAQIHGVAFDSPELLRVMLPDLQPHEHAVAVANLQLNGPVVAVSLFGHGFHQLLALASESSNFGLKVLSGKVAICDTKAAKTRFLSFEEHFSQRSKVIFPARSG